MSLLFFVAKADVGFNKGFLGGGTTNGTTGLTLIEGFDFSNETISAPAVALSEAKFGMAGVSNGLKGFWGGGRIGSTVINTIEGMSFADDTHLNPSAVLATSRYGAGGVSSFSRGYYGGGYTGSTMTAEIDGIEYSNETAINPSAALVTARFQAIGIQSTSRGYYTGGTPVTNYTVLSSEIDGIQFNNETAINPSATLVTARYGHGGLSSPTRGYMCAGGTNGTIRSVEYLEFSTETIVAIGNTFATNRSVMGAIHNTTKGYLCGGWSGAGNYSTIADLTFSTQTSQVIAATISVARRALTGISSP